MKIFNHLGSRLNQIALMYFVFEAKEVQIKLQAPNPNDLNEKLKRNRKISLSIFIAYVVLELYKMSYYVL